MTAHAMRAAYLIAATAVAGLALASCANDTLRTSRLDSNGLTVVTLNEPVVLALPAHELAAAARDYAYLGPVEINRMGERTYLLWIGLASTIDRKLINVRPSQAEVLALLIDGRPVTLPLVDWTTDLDRPPYDASAPLYVTLSAHASLNQIRMIARAESVEVQLISATGSARQYRKWDGDWASWSLLVVAE